jgi:hypothetical protein
MWGHAVTITYTLVIRFRNTAAALNRTLMRLFSSALKTSPHHPPGGAGVRAGSEFARVQESAEACAIVCARVMPDL